MSLPPRLPLPLPLPLPFILVSFKRLQEYIEICDTFYS